MFGSNDSVDANGYITMKTDTLGGTTLTKTNFVTKVSNSVERYLFFPTMPTSVSGSNMLTVGYKDANDKYCAFAEDFEVSAMTLRGYHRCYNWFFRREDLIAPVTLDTSDSTKTYSGVDDFTPLYKVSKYRDFFVANLPQPQKSVIGDVYLPLGTSAPVSVYGDGSEINFHTQATNAPDTNLLLTGQTISGNYNTIGFDKTGQNTPSGKLMVSEDPEKSGLIGTADLSAALAAPVNALREIIATQRIYEKFAQGSRIEETIAIQYHVNCPELALQIPEYLGGYSVPINIAECTDLSTNLGAVGAKSATSHVKHDVTKSFTQWGIILGLCAVRQNRLYASAVELGYFRKRIFDFYWPSFSHLGEMPTPNKSLFPFERANETFGFHEAWAEYKYKPSRVSGQIMDYADFNTYVFADLYTGCPYLSQEWIEEDDSQLRYAMGLADDNPVNDFIMDVAVLDTAVRPMPLNSIPGLMDHF